jgi:hypothetical protein
MYLLSIACFRTTPGCAEHLSGGSDSSERTRKPESPIAAVLYDVMLQGMLMLQE